MRGCDLVVAGIGGQGVLSLFDVLCAVADVAGWTCLGTVHKGGAQSLGSVSAELRLRPQPSAALAATIPPGALDVLVALEPWEALRCAAALGPPRAALIERSSASAGLAEVDRGRDPAAEFAAVCPDADIRPLRTDAAARFGDPRMANYLAGELALPLLPAPLRDPARFRRLFAARVRAVVHHLEELPL